MVGRETLCCQISSFPIINLILRCKSSASLPPEACCHRANSSRLEEKENTPAVSPTIGQGLKIDCVIAAPSTNISPIENHFSGLPRDHCSEALFEFMLCEAMRDCRGDIDARLLSGLSLTHGSRPVQGRTLPASIAWPHLTKTKRLCVAMERMALGLIARHRSPLHGPQSWWYISKYALQRRLESLHFASRHQIVAITQRLAS